MSEESSDKSLKCLWGDCGEVLTTADELYAHTCEHVGRKSDNNLKLTCAWSECRLSFSKRDHLTSHIRIHIALKPHACHTCSKSFKRPQDLKKHQKIHTEEHQLQHKHSKAVKANEIDAIGEESKYRPTHPAQPLIPQQSSESKYRPTHPAQPLIPQQSSVNDRPDPELFRYRQSPYPDPDRYQQRRISSNSPYPDDQRPQSSSYPYPPPHRLNPPQLIPRPVEFAPAPSPNIYYDFADVSTRSLYPATESIRQNIDHHPSHQFTGPTLSPILPPRVGSDSRTSSLNNGFSLGGRRGASFEATAISFLADIKGKRFDTIGLGKQLDELGAYPNLHEFVSSRLTGDRLRDDLLLPDYRNLEIQSTDLEAIQELLKFYDSPIIINDNDQFVASPIHSPTLTSAVLPSPSDQPFINHLPTHSRSDSPLRSDSIGLTSLLLAAGIKLEREDSGNETASNRAHVSPMRTTEPRKLSLPSMRRLFNGNDEVDQLLEERVKRSREEERHVTKGVAELKEGPLGRNYLVERQLSTSVRHLDIEQQLTQQWPTETKRNIEEGDSPHQAKKSKLNHVTPILIPNNRGSEIGGGSTEEASATDARRRQTLKNLASYVSESFNRSQGQKVL